MKAVIATLLALLGVAAASYRFSGKYNGYYVGKCGNDGFYYNNGDSFVICSNGNAYNQPCAPGSRNSAPKNYHQGNSYGYSDFCDVNLVDFGYGARHAGYGNDNRVHGHNSYAYNSYDSYRPEQYLNADGHATRGAYNAYNRFGNGYEHNNYHNNVYNNNRGYRQESYRQPASSYGTKTVVKKVSYSNKH